MCRSSPFVECPILLNSGSQNSGNHAPPRTAYLGLTYRLKLPFKRPRCSSKDILRNLKPTHRYNFPQTCMTAMRPLKIQEDITLNLIHPRLGVLSLSLLRTPHIVFHPSPLRNRYCTCQVTFAWYVGCRRQIVLPLVLGGNPSTNWETL